MTNVYYHTLHTYMYIYAYIYIHKYNDCIICHLQLYIYISSKVEGKCVFGGNCRKSIVIYRCTCKCGAYYIGNTQNYVKQRMTGHFAETRNLVNKGGASDTFAKHFATHFNKCDGINKRSKPPINANHIRRLCKIDILWQGNPISCMKSFGKLNCSLCMNERLQILKAQKSEKFSKTKKLINSSRELCGACRHKSKFRRYRFRDPPSTDEGLLSPEMSDISTARLILPSSGFSDFESDLSVPYSPRAGTSVEKSNSNYVVDL